MLPGDSIERGNLKSDLALQYARLDAKDYSSRESYLL